MNAWFYLRSHISFCKKMQIQTLCILERKLPNRSTANFLGLHMCLWSPKSTNESCAWKSQILENIYDCSSWSGVSWDSCYKSSKNGKTNQWNWKHQVFSKKISLWNYWNTLNRSFKIKPPQGNYLFLPSKHFSGNNIIFLFTCLC